jgi:LAO/AO transport system kinase
MEIADIFIVNKADRPDADIFLRNLRTMLAPSFSRHSSEVPVIKTIASQKQGINSWLHAIEDHLARHEFSDKRAWLLAERAYHLIERNRMKDVNKQRLKETIEDLQQRHAFNLYQFVQKFK